MQEKWRAENTTSTQTIVIGLSYAASARLPLFLFTKRTPSMASFHERFGADQARVREGRNWLDRAEEEGRPLLACDWQLICWPATV